MRRTWIAIATALCSLAGCETSTRSCSMIGCADGLTVEFQTASWPQGAWQVDVKTPTETRTCTATLPLPPSGASTCSDKLMLMTSGSALAVTEHKLIGVQLPDAPSEVTVTVTRNGTKVAEKTLKPTYKKSQPNGSACEPICTQAGDKLAW